MILIDGKHRELKNVCHERGLDYKVCSSRFQRGDSVERILRPTDVKWKKKDSHMMQSVIDHELKGKTPIPGLYKGMSRKQIDALLSGNCNEFLRS